MHAIVATPMSGERLAQPDGVGEVPSGSAAMPNPLNDSIIRLWIRPWYSKSDRSSDERVVHRLEA